MRLLLVLVVVSVASPALAFSIESPIAPGCHERLTAQGAAMVPWGPDAPSLVADDAHRRLVASVPFTVPAAAVDDPRLLALLIGVRSPDIGGDAITDLDRLAAIHGAAGHQREHCLREAADDGDAGSATAVAACREEILADLDAALGPGDTIDAGTESITIALAFQGPRTIDVPRFYYRVGRALHALQDSFPHTFRDASGHHIVSVLNWVDWVSRHDYDAARDGMHHVAARDECGADDAAAPRAALAQQATIDLLTALADPTMGRAGRLARATAVLDDWLVVTPGCDATNAYCGAPDAVVAHGCDVGGGGRFGLWMLLPLLVLAFRRRRTTLALALLVALVLSPSISKADEPTATSAAGVGETRVGSETPSHHRSFGATASVSGSIDLPAFAVTMGARYFPSEEWRLGLDVELNPWISVGGRTQLALGTFNSYVSAQWDWARAGQFSVGTRVAAGLSVLLFDMVGASAGDVGLYLGATLIGVGFHITDAWELRVDPEAAILLPHLVGLPIDYWQYRLTVSVVWRP